jgi:pimeloyl-ACP methyl ester carboxylesterase
VCGLSLGGYLAIDLAARYPERVAGLVISGASAEPSGRVFPVAIRWLARIMDRTSAPRLDRINRTWFRQRYSPATANAVLAGGFGYEAGAAALYELIGRDARAAFASYPGPKLILNGQLDLPFRLGQRGFRKAARDARVVVLARATHLANLDRPSAYSSALARFAADVFGTRPDDAPAV